MPRATIESSAPSPRAALWLVVPLAAASLGALGWLQADRLRSAGATDDPTLAVAVLAAGTCLAVAGWWIGGLAMLTLAAVARRLRWAGLERRATRLTPGLVARTTAAAVGIQLAVLSPAHADDAALDPFWGSAASGTEQLAAPGEQPSTTDAAAPAAIPSADGTSPASGTSANGTPGAEGGLGGTDAASEPGTATDPGAPASPDLPAGGSPAAGTTTGGAPAAGTPTGLPLGRSTGQADTRAGAPDGTTNSIANPPARERVADGVITVMAGDTLWDLSSQLLGPDVSDATVSQHLASWLEHNTLAEHGDLIHPGDQLRVPPQLLTQQNARE